MHLDTEPHGPCDSPAVGLCFLLALIGVRSRALELFRIPEEHFRACQVGAFLELLLDEFLCCLVEHHLQDSGGGGHLLAVKRDACGGAVTAGGRRGVDAHRRVAVSVVSPCAAGGGGDAGALRNEHGQGQYIQPGAIS
jgi:hypothetical protein